MLYSVLGKDFCSFLRGGGWQIFRWQKGFLVPYRDTSVSFFCHRLMSPTKNTNGIKTRLFWESLLLDGSKIFKTFRYPEKEEEFSLPPADNGLIKFQTQAPPPLNSARPLSHPPLPTFNLPWLGEERGIQHGFQKSQNIRDSLEMYLVIFSTLVD